MGWVDFMGTTLTDVVPIEGDGVEMGLMFTTVSLLFSTKPSVKYQQHSHFTYFYCDTK